MILSLFEAHHIFLRVVTTCVRCVKVCVVRLGQLGTIYFFLFVSRFLFSLFTFLDFIKITQIEFISLRS